MAENYKARPRLQFVIFSLKSHHSLCTYSHTNTLQNQCYGTVKMQSTVNHCFLFQWFLRFSSRDLGSSKLLNVITSGPKKSIASGIIDIWSQWVADNSSRVIIKRLVLYLKWFDVKIYHLSSTDSDVSENVDWLQPFNFFVSSALFKFKKFSSVSHLVQSIKVQIFHIFDFWQKKW